MTTFLSQRRVRILQDQTRATNSTASKSNIVSYKSFDLLRPTTNDLQLPMTKGELTISVDKMHSFTTLSTRRMLLEYIRGVGVMTQLRAAAGKTPPNIARPARLAHVSFFTFNILSTRHLSTRRTELVGRRPVTEESMDWNVSVVRFPSSFYFYFFLFLFGESPR